MFIGVTTLFILAWRPSWRGIMEFVSAWPFKYSHWSQRSVFCVKWSVGQIISYPWYIHPALYWFVLDSQKYTQTHTHTNTLIEQWLRSIRVHSIQSGRKQINTAQDTLHLWSEIHTHTHTHTPHFPNHFPSIWIILWTSKYCYSCCYYYYCKIKLLILLPQFWTFIILFKRDPIFI